MQTEVDRHGFGNLLLLCPIHHDVVDDDPEAYAVQRLVNMKSEHERLSARVLEPDDEIAAQFVTKLCNVRVEGGSVIVTNNQSGGIAAHTVNILAPAARRISPIQRQRMTSALSCYPQARVEIEIPLGSGADASNYADDIAAVLRGVGWTVNGPAFSTRTPVSRGLELVQRNRGAATPAMDALALAFDAASIGFTPLFDSTQTLRDDTLGIYIGPPS